MEFGQILGPGSTVSHVNLSTFNIPTFLRLDSREGCWELVGKCLESLKSE